MKSKERVLYARRCEISGEGMNEGYLVGGCTTIKYRSDLLKFICSVSGDWKEGFSDEEVLNESYGLGNWFYTTWEDEDDYQYEEINGELKNL